MIRIPSKIIICILAFTLVLSSCIKDDEITLVTDILEEESTTPTLPETPYDYRSAFDFPEHFTNDPLLGLFSGGFEPEDVGLTDDGATLGRVLFYDKKLSIIR